MIGFERVPTEGLAATQAIITFNSTWKPFNLKFLSVFDEAKYQLTFSPLFMNLFKSKTIFKSIWHHHKTGRYIKTTLNFFLTMDVIVL